MQKINDKLQKIQDADNTSSNNSNKLKLKKLNSLRKKAIKQILEYNGMFNLKFLLAWSKTINFQFWMREFNFNIAALSP